jgi:isopenicillin N synthase-like dioxygenase
MSDIPVPTVDLASPNVVAELKEACEKCGFFLIKNHGVNRGVVDAAWAAVRAFFDSPLANKEAVAMDASYPYGYGGMNTEKAGNEGGASAYATGDLKESFQVCLSSAAAPAAVPPCRWPREPAALPAAFTAYYREMEALAARLLAHFAAALALPPDFFPPLMDAHWSALRSLNYPEQLTAPNPGQLRIAPHSDYGVITLLRADDAPGGLEVLRSDGSWSAVSIPDDAFCVNLGDLMQRWTNDAWRSTVHRVVNPPADPGVPTRRQSIAYFCNLNKDALVEAIPSCVTAAAPRRYEPINAFEHLMVRARGRWGEGGGGANASAARPTIADYFLPLAPLAGAPRARHRRRKGL